jgi:peroxiredoxin
MDALGMSKTNVLKLLVLGAIVGATVFLIISSRRPAPVKSGDAAPNFTLPTLDGPRISLRDYRSHVVVVNFWATWCPPCVEETPSLKRFADEMQSDGVKVIGVSVDQDEAALRKFVAEAQLSFPIARDPEAAVAARYGTFKFPETYIVDSEGKIAEKLIGAIDWQDPRIVGRIKSLAHSSGR